MFYIPIILGTAREGRQSEKVAKFMLEELTELSRGLDFKTDLIDVRDFRISATDNTQKSPTAIALAEKISIADAFVIVTPEYNHGYPGELKMMLDLLYAQYARKPVGFCGVSAGPWGGNRVVEQLRLIAIELHMVPIREALYFPLVQTLFDEKGVAEDPSLYQGRIKVFIDELLWYAKTLRAGREQKS